MAKHLIRLQLFTVLMILAGQCASAAEPMTLKVLSYNIHHGEGVDGQLDLPRIAKVINSVRPDLVALQEVDHTATRTGSVDQPKELARLTELQVVFGANIDLQGGHYGNAILSRFPISKHANHLLPNLDNGEQRGVLSAHIQLNDAQSLRLLATHFDHRRDDRERVASAAAIKQLFENGSRQPALLAGDLNDVVESSTLKKLLEHWTVANDSPLPTIPVSQPTRQIDFILFHPAENWKVVDVRVLEEVVASDHRAILATLQLLR